MKSFRVAGITLISHLSKMLVNLYIIKQIATVYGPEGLGTFGNFISLVGISSTLAGGGILSGIIKYVSEFSHSTYRQLNFLGSAFLYSVCTSILVFTTGLIFINSLTNYIFLKEDYTAYIFFFLLMQFFISFNNFTFGVVNGLKKNRLYAFFILIGNLISFIVAFYGINYFGTWGMIIAIMAPLIFPFIPVFFYVINQRRCIKYIRFNTFYQEGKLLSKFSLMLIVSSICFPVVEMVIRNLLIHKIGLGAAGYWQAIIKLSTAYLGFYSLFLTFYFMPIISAINTKQSIYFEVKKMLHFISLLFGLMILFFIFFKKQVIYYALSKDFVQISHLFVLQMIGDFFRVITWIIGSVIVAKAATKLYILGEILQGSMFLAFTCLGLAYHPTLQNVINAYIATYILYFFMIFTSSYFYFVRKN